MDEKPTIRIYERIQYGPLWWQAYYEPGHIDAGVADEMAIEKRFTDEELAVENYEQTERCEIAMHGGPVDAHGNRIESLAVESDRLGVILRMGDLPDHDDDGDEDEYYFGEDGDY
jgi:hypothetical protein